MQSKCRITLRIVVGLLSAALFHTAARAEELKPLLGKESKLLLDESFDAGELAPKWTLNVGKLDVVDGVLQARQLKADNHIGACRYALPLQDCAVQIDFQLGGARMMHLGFDPAPGEIKKRGHLFALMVTPDGWNITEQPDKANAASTSKVLAEGKTKFEADRWYTLLLEVKGAEVAAQVAGKEPLRGSSKDFAAKKPGLVFRAGGTDDKPVSFDNLRVWELD